MALDFSHIVPPREPANEEILKGKPIIVTASNALIPIQVISIELAKVKLNQHLQKVDEMFTQAKGLTVDSDISNEEAVALGTSAKSLFKKIEELRKSLISEPQEYVDQINAIAKMLTEKLDTTSKGKETVVSLMKQKITQYSAFVEQQRREAELAAQKATQEAQKKLDERAKETGTTPVKLPDPIIPKKDTITRTQTGSAYAQKRWTFEIIEPHYQKQLITNLKIQWDKFLKELNAMVGDKDFPFPIISITDSIENLKNIAPYLTISDTEIRNAIKAGVREIPGIRIFESQGTSFRT
jgi:hypothetical protein